MPNVFVINLIFASGILFGLTFKPLILGILKAARIMVFPKKTKEQRIAKQRFLGTSHVFSLARAVEERQPNLAAELRSIAGRDGV